MKTGFLVFAFAVPLLILAGSFPNASALLLCLAFVSQYAGLLVERWYFFAEARHPQNLYYQGVS
jgi:DMSO reductase anchor subunit